MNISSTWSSSSSGTGVSADFSKWTTTIDNSMIIDNANYSGVSTTINYKENNVYIECEDGVKRTLKEYVLWVFNNQMTSSNEEVHKKYAPCPSLEEQLI